MARNVYEKQSRRRVMVPITYKLLEQILTNRHSKEIQVFGLPKDAVLINVLGKYESKRADCIFEHDSFDEVPAGQKLPLLLLKSRFKQLPKDQ